MKRVIPSIIARSQKELDSRIKKINSNTFHLDIMDGKFVKNKSLWFNFKLIKGKNYHAHLMIKNPQAWIKKHWRKADTIIFHVESCKNKKEIDEIVSLIKSRKRKVGIALNPRTPISKIKDHLKKIDFVLIMTVNPGKYGSKFLPKTLKKIRQLRKMKREMEVGVDGGINPRTIRSASGAGANTFVSGSYIQKSEDSRKALKGLIILSK